MKMRKVDVRGYINEESKEITVDNRNQYISKHNEFAEIFHLWIKSYKVG